jgi:ABC-type glycerol-3-phosphate transport system substrate-binding protein
VDLPFTISLAGNFDRERLAALDALIARYEVANPGIRVEVVRAPKDKTRRHGWIRDTLSTGDRSIDILLLDATWPAEFAADGGLVALDERLAPLGFEMSDYLPATLQANRLDGQLVALPWTADGGLLYYRQDLLDRYGQDVPATWEELQRIALDIKEGESLPYGFVWSGVAAENLTCSTLEHIWSQGGSLLDWAGNATFDNPQTRAGLQQMNGLALSGASPTDISKWDDAAAFVAFQDGEAVFLRDWFTVWPYLDGEDSPVAGQVGIATLPASCLGGQSLALSAHSQHPQEALRFMAFLAGTPQQVHMASEGDQPPAAAAAYEDAELLASRPWVAILGTAFSSARPRPSLADYPRVSEVVRTQVNRMLAGEQDVETTAVNIQEGLESVLR